VVGLQHLPLVVAPADSADEGPRSAAVIRTPDQRLRVFVSSTLDELADERRSVSRAISALRLIPVMFELGARPHPPRELYRAYLEQSDIFIGLYWQRYGQVSAGMELSGLEDEFELSRALPRLLYVKAPAPYREPRLSDLLARIERQASYRTFRTPAELGRLVRDDLATLLSERFAAEPPSAARPPPGGPRPLPVAVTSLVGREAAIDAVAGLVGRPDARLFTLTGPSGVGKTRLAVAVGERVRDRFDAGVVFVSLAGVTEPEQALPVIGRAVGADLTATRSPLQALVERFGDDRWLLILDNLEQVLDAARDLDELLVECGGVAILATSLTALRLRAEREYPVPPLPLPPDAAIVAVEDLASSPGVALFVDRARAVRYGFALTQANAPAVVEIIRRLEGLPLAIELAAARSRLLDPDALLDRLAGSLDALGTGTVDMPERQQTLRATVEWSVGLLDDAERSLLETMAVFVDGWSVHAAADVAGLDEDRAFELTEALAAHSLIYHDLAEHGPRSRMLETIREFVAERLAARPDVADIQRRHADHYRRAAQQADRPMRHGGRREWAERLLAETGNLGAAVRWYLAHDRTPLAGLFRVTTPWVLWPFLGVRLDIMDEARSWVDELLADADSLEPLARAEVLWTAVVVDLEASDEQAALAAGERLAPLLDQIDDPYLEAVGQLTLAWIAVITNDMDRAVREASQSLEKLFDQDEPIWTAVALLTVGSLESAVGRYDDADGHLTQVRDLAERSDDAWLAVSARVGLAVVALMRGRLGDARAVLDEALDLSLASRSSYSLTVSLATFARLVYAEGDAARAARLVGATDVLRRRAGVRVWSLRREAEAAAGIRQALGADRFDHEFAAGARLGRDEAVAAAREGSGAGIEVP
jgi:predicted ATPase